MSIEINHVLNGREIADLLVYVFNPYLKSRASSVIHPYLLGEDNSRVPFYYALQKGLKPPCNLPSVQFSFKGTLRPEQISIVERSFELLRLNHTLLLSTHVGFGKTILAIYIMTQLRMKTFIIVNRIVLMQQWYASIKSFSDARVCILEAGIEFDSDEFDVFIINIVNVPKLDTCLFDIGTLILDEAHLILSNKMCNNLLYFTPRYTIGLTATPYRTDGSNKLFELFLGSEKIFKPLLRTHIVYKILTGFKPVIQTRAGKVNWDSVLSQQAESIERNELIVNLVSARPDKVFMILCKRVSQIKLLRDLFRARNIEVEAVYGTERIDVSNQERRVLIGTVQKLGVGFDDKRINSLILACDLQEYFIQYLGRVFRDPNVEPEIFDLVDDEFILKKHWKARADVYESAGGKILTHLPEAFI